MKIGFIGCGNMGEAFLKSLLEARIAKSENVYVRVKTDERAAQLQQQYHVSLETHANEIGACDIVILAVKPQTLSEIELNAQDGCIILSVLAGTSIRTLENKFPNAKVVRTMPNLALSVNFGMSGICFSPNAQFTEPEKALVKVCFMSNGRILEVDNEDDLDAVTALSGTGPAYFFLFLEKLTAVAERLGFSKSDSEYLIRQTFFGAAEILRINDQDSPGDWRQKVTSEKGTTEAAMKLFLESDFEEIIAGAIKAAQNRSRELGESEATSA